MSQFVTDYQRRIAKDFKEASDGCIATIIGNLALAKSTGRLAESIVEPCRMLAFSNDMRIALTEYANEPDTAYARFADRVLNAENNVLDTCYDYYVANKMIEPEVYVLIAFDALNVEMGDE